ncbi:Hypothetical predicted protein [Pelobates cultripes]|uniref:Uncharacterized protein n=1 Tax=Pelobates cultripes TaxID=61616 RepID=A0AAD1VTF4_PELCU|nr:Hypothetical predicted protein [Pelobates cultripes]
MPVKVIPAPTTSDTPMLVSAHCSSKRTSKMADALGMQAGTTKQFQGALLNSVERFLLRLDKAFTWFRTELEIRMATTKRQPQEGDGKC